MARTVLVLEDEPIIALDVEGILTDAGLDVSANANTSAKALDWLERNTPDVAIIDIDLQDGSSAAVARWLVDRAVPFIVFSGSSRSERAIDPVFLAGRWLEKPAPATELVEAVRSMMSRFDAPAAIQ